MKQEEEKKMKEEEENIVEVRIMPCLYGADGV